MQSGRYPWSGFPQRARRAGAAGGPPKRLAPPDGARSSWRPERISHPAAGGCARVPRHLSQEALRAQAYEIPSAHRPDYFPVLYCRLMSELLEVERHARVEIGTAGYRRRAGRRGRTVFTEDAVRRANPIQLTGTLAWNSGFAVSTCSDATAPWACLRRLRSSASLLPRAGRRFPVPAGAVG